MITRTSMSRLATAAIVVASGILAVGSPAGAAAMAAHPQFPQAKPIKNAHNALDVPYLPERVTGSVHDRWVTMNIHWPKDEARHPCIIFIHGGGYGGGDKDGGYGGAGGPPRKLLTRAVAEGFVAVNLNYILGNGIHPQVFHDFKSAVRFLRSHADKYHIDPARIAAWGFSAGGWLASSGGFTTADDLFNVAASDLATPWGARRKRQNQLRVPFDDPRSPWADHSARLTAIVADFWSKRELTFYGPDDPAVLTYVGTGGSHKLVRLADKVGNEGRQIVLTNEKYRGKSSLHIPPINAASQKLDGSDGASTLQDEAFKWLRQKLVASPKAVAPEARPLRRQFAQSVQVRLVSPGKATIRYTTDGGKPTADSPVYNKPFELMMTTTVKARVWAKGFKPSAVATFTFTKSDVPPAITNPATLPKAKVGQAYRVAFAADGAVGWWNLGGHAQTTTKMHTKDVVAPLGVAIDPETGILSGTPTKAGSFTLQVQAAAGLGRIADTRTYVLVVEE